MYSQASEVLVLGTCFEFLSKFRFYATLCPPLPIPLIHHSFQPRIDPPEPQHPISICLCAAMHCFAGLVCLFSTKCCMLHPSPSSTPTTTYSFQKNHSGSTGRYLRGAFPAFFSSQLLEITTCPTYIWYVTLCFPFFSFWFKC